jgi:hypothetical protein
MALNIKRLETADHPDLYLKELTDGIQLSGVDVGEHERETKYQSSLKLKLIKTSSKKAELMRSLWCIG